MLVHRKVTPALNLPVFIFKPRPKCFIQEHTTLYPQISPAWLEHGPLDPESSALTRRPPHLDACVNFVFRYKDGHKTAIYSSTQSWTATKRQTWLRWVRNPSSCVRALLHDYTNFTAKPSCSSLSCKNWGHSATVVSPKIFAFFNPYS